MHSSAQPDQMVHLIDDGISLPITMSHVLRDAGFKIRTYTSATEMLEAQRAAPRGCFLLDVHTAGGPDGLEIQAELLRRGEPLPVIFLTGHGDISMSVKAIKLGAVDFLTKEATREILLSTVTEAMAKEQETWSLRQKGTNLKNRWQTLTHCERRVFSGVIAGLSNKRIAEKLGSTERTVRAHRASVMQKMEVHSIAELVHQAQELGLFMDLV